MFTARLMYAVSSGHSARRRPPRVTPNSSRRECVPTTKSAYRCSKPSAVSPAGPETACSRSSAPVRRVCSTAARAVNVGWAVSCSTKWVQHSRSSSPYRSRARSARSVTGRCSSSARRPGSRSAANNRSASRAPAAAKVSWAAATAASLSCSGTEAYADAMRSPRTRASFSGPAGFGSGRTGSATRPAPGFGASTDFATVETTVDASRTTTASSPLISRPPFPRTAS